MSHNAGTVSGQPLTEQTQLGLNDLLASAPSNGDYLVAQSSTTWAPEPSLGGDGSAIALGLTATAASSVTDPAILSNNSNARSYPFFITAGQDLSTDGITLLGSETQFGPNWNTKFRIDQNGRYLIIAHMPYNQTGSSVGTAAGGGITTTLTGFANSGPFYGQYYMRSQLSRNVRKTFKLMTIIDITTAPFSFRFYNLYGSTAWQNVKPADVQTQYLEITRLA